jgi:hypothetical protein
MGYDFEKIKTIDLWEIIQSEGGVEMVKEACNINDGKHGRGYLRVFDTSFGKLAVTRFDSGRYLFKRQGEEDGGSIIDYYMLTKGLPLRDAIQYTAALIEDPKPLTPKPSITPKPRIKPQEKAEHDLSFVQTYIKDYAYPISKSAYLSDRGLSDKTIGSERFEGRIYESKNKRNTIFPHYGKEGVTGYEISNYGYKAFSSHGLKRLWCSRTKDDDDVLVITESAIDALSFYQLHGAMKARYVSTAGRPSDSQLALLKSAAEKISEKGGRIICAFDNDAGGYAIYNIIRSHIGQHVEREFPWITGKDWNDIIMGNV